MSDQENNQNTELEDLENFNDSDVQDQLPNRSRHVVSEAMKRIEQAKLYETLLKHRLFSPDSARAEIISIVENEIKDFVLERLECLLGMRQTTDKNPALSFTQEQIQALQSIADKLIQSKTNKTPQLNMVHTKSEVVLNTVNVGPENINNINNLKQKPANSKNKNTKSTPERKISQVINPNNPPKPIPKMSYVNMLTQASVLDRGGINIVSNEEGDNLTQSQLSHLINLIQSSSTSTKTD